MKLNNEQNTIERSSTFKETGFRIAANAHAFKILSSNLYTDTKLAIVRELSTNAADAHVEAGNADVPFDVHLPNGMEPDFSIRDYGTGLSPEDVENIYTTYFESTRNKSDEYTGALGLGSKSPFAYTDMFSVVSYYNGIMYTYSAFKSESGEPSIALLSQTETNEPNGLKVSITVERHDYGAFAEKARQIYRFFKLRPNISGARIEFNNAEPLLKGDFWTINRNSTNYNSAIYAVMGNIAYPVSQGQIYNHQFKQQAEVHIHVPIGSCSISASREELHYDEKTLAFLRQQINLVQEEALEQIKEKIKDYTVTLEQCLAAKAFRSVIEVQAEYQHIDGEKDGAYAVRKVYLDSGRKQDRLVVYQYIEYFRPDLDKSYVFIENDVNELTNKTKRNLKYYIQNNKGTFYLAVIKDPVVFAATFGSVAIKLSNLPNAPRAVRTQSTGSRTFIKQIRQFSDSKNAAEQWKNAQKAEISDSGLVVKRRSDHMIDFNGRVCKPENVLAIAKLFGYSVVYGLPEKRYEKLRKELGLAELVTILKAKLQVIVDSADEFELSAFHYDKPEFHHAALAGLSDICDKMHKVMRTPNKLTEYTNAISLLDITVPPGIDYGKEFYETYPLLRYLNYQANRNDILEYIKLKS